MKRVPLVLFGLAALAAPALGGEPSTALLDHLSEELRLRETGQVGEARPPSANAFGTGSSVTVIPATAFFPGPGIKGGLYSIDDLGILKGQVGGTVGFWAPLHLPTGAMIETLCLVAEESDTAGSLNLFLIGTEVDATPSWAHDPFTTFVSTGLPETPGWTRVCLPDLEILYRAIDDADGDGMAGSLSYSLLVTFNSDPEDGPDEQQLGSVQIGWRRTTSRAPSVATFDDVPTDHLFFQQIEALAASGVTSGCDADSFCPSDPLTRAQMAAFLAKALGLHWPQ